MLNYERIIDQKSSGMSADKKTKPVKHSSGYNHRKHRRRSRFLGLLLIVLLVGASYTTYRVVKTRQKANEQTQGATEAIRQVIDGSDTTVELTKVSSKLGFALQYDPSLVVVSGILADKSVVADKQLGSGSYTSVKAQPKGLGDSAPETGSSIEVKTSSVKNFMEQQKRVFGSDLSDQKVTDAYFKADVASGESLDLINDSVEKIGTVTYQKHVYQVASQSTAKTRITVYTTVQNGRPYGVIIRQPASTTDTQAAGFAQILASLQYMAPEDASILGVLPKGRVSLVAVEAPVNFVNTPSDLNSDSVLKVVAKRQPAVVRIGAIACASLTITGANGARLANINDACGVEAGSGSIVSSDGIISTNGHVVKVAAPAIYQTYLILTLTAENKEPFQDYLQYLIKSGMMTKAEVQGLLDEIRGGSDAAFSQLLGQIDEIDASNFTVSNFKESFAVQLSDEPIKPKLEGGKASFVFSDKNVEAKLIAWDYDPSFSKGGNQNIAESENSDVAILKMEGKDFPIVPLGSIDSIGPQSELTAIGWPGFVDGALQTEKKRTIPSATQGPVTQIVTDYEKSHRNLIVANLPIAQGNSGGPAFNKDGEVVGLTTYSGDSGDPEAGKTKFSKVGILRDISDYKVLLSKNALQLNTESKINTAWNEGVEKFSIAHYKEAVSKFDEVKKSYPQNYLAQQFVDVANDKIAKGEDLSGDKAIRTLLVILAGFAAGLAIVVVALLHHFKKGRSALAQTHLPVGPQLATDMGAFMPTPVMVTQPGAMMSQQQVPAAYTQPPQPMPQPPAVPPQMAQPIAVVSQVISPATYSQPQPQPQSPVQPQTYAPAATVAPTVNPNQPPTPPQPPLVQ